MTATDAFTTAARAEAERLYANNPNYWQEKSGFGTGAEWARDHLAAQEPTDAEVEAVARHFYQTQTGSDLIGTSIYRDNWLRSARVALSAAKEAR